MTRTMRKPTRMEEEEGEDNEEDEDEEDKEDEEDEEVVYVWNPFSLRRRRTRMRRLCMHGIPSLSCQRPDNEFG